MKNTLLTLLAVSITVCAAGLVYFVQNQHAQINNPPVNDSQKETIPYDSENGKTAPTKQEIEYFRGRPVTAKTVIIMLKPNVTESDKNDLFRRKEKLEVTFLKVSGIYIVTSKILSTEELIDYFSKQPEVQTAEPSHLLELTVIPNEPDFSFLWGFWNLAQTIQGQAGFFGIDIKAKNAWNITTGNQSNVIAVVDSGVDYSHVDLIDNIWTAPRSYTLDLGENGSTITCGAGTRGYDAFENDCFPTDINNPIHPTNPGRESHGTHIAGIIGAKANNNQGVAGVNWSASILPIRFTDAQVFTETNLFKGLEYILQLKNEFGDQANIRVVNASYSTPVTTAAHFSLVSRLNAAGILLVASAGNGGPDEMADNNDVMPVYPANYDIPNVISVAAIDNRGARPSTSNYGPTTVDLGAPGVNIYSTMRENAYGWRSGTSQATPQVSGAALLILSRCDLDTSTLRSLILNNTDSTMGLANETATGGRLNVYRALQQCSPEPVPTAYSATILQPVAPGNLGEIFFLSDINTFGQVIGATSVSGENWHRTFTWDSSSGITVLPPFFVNRPNIGRRINKNGWLLGGEIIPGPNAGFFYNPQTGLHDIGTISGYGEAEGFGINDANVIVGSINGGQSFASAPFVRRTDGTLSAIRPYANTTGGSAVDINNRGVAAVWTVDSNTNTDIGFTHDTNTNSATLIPVPTGYNSVRPNAINNAGVVIGNATPTDPNGIRNSFWYHPDTGTRIITSTQGGVLLTDVNDSGEAVGSIRTQNNTFLPIFYDRFNGIRLQSTVLPSNITGCDVISNRGQLLCGTDQPAREAVLTPSIPTPVGTNVNVVTGSVAVSYSNVLTSGETIVGPLPLPPLAQLPTNYLLTGSSLAYNVATTATFSGTNRVCFNLTSIPNETTFNRVKLLHLENGSYVDRTISRDFSTLEVCAAVTSFSPFVTAVAQTPTAADVSISGRILSPAFRAVSKARVTLIGPTSTRSTISNSFGHFLFDNLQVGETYIIQVGHKVYRFQPKVVNLLDELTAVDFIAVD